MVLLLLKKVNNLEEYEGSVSVFFPTQQPLKQALWWQEHVFVNIFAVVYIFFLYSSYCKYSVSYICPLLVSSKSSKSRKSMEFERTRCYISSRAFLLWKTKKSRSGLVLCGDWWGHFQFFHPVSQHWGRLGRGWGKNIPDHALCICMQIYAYDSANMSPAGSCLAKIFTFWNLLVNC